MSLNRVIGSQGRIPWHSSADFKWFKTCTSGEVVLMGRKTFDSLGKPLPNRTNLVVTRQARIPNVETVHALDAFDPRAFAPREVWVIGGSDIYAQLLPRCSDLYLTVMQRHVEGDAMFPNFEEAFEKVATVMCTEEFVIYHYRNRAAAG